MNHATDAGDVPETAEMETPAIAADPTRADRMMAQLGGVPGLIYSSLPVLLFVGTSRLLGLSAAVELGP